MVRPGLFSHSWKRPWCLRAVQEELGLPQHKLVTESPRTWGSRLKAIQRLPEQEKAIKSWLLNGQPGFWLILQMPCPLGIMSRLYSRPIFHLFNSELLQGKDEGSDLTKKFKKSILDYMMTKYSSPEVEELINMASFLDLRLQHRVLGVIRFKSAPKIISSDSMIILSIFGKIYALTLVMHQR